MNWPYTAITVELVPADPEDPATKSGWEARVRYESVGHGEASGKLWPTAREAFEDGEQMLVQALKAKEDEVRETLDGIRVGLKEEA